MFKINPLEGVLEGTCDGTKNGQKYSFRPLPGFNLKTFPMMLVAGKVAICVLNLATNYMQALIKKTSAP